jgi:hypothetical protein
MDTLDRLYFIEVEWRDHKPQQKKKRITMVKEYEDGWYTQGVLWRKVNKTGINDAGLAGVGQRTLLCMMGLNRLERCM